MKFIVIFCLIILNSCVDYYRTADGGFRVSNPKVFKYNKDKYKNLRSGLIDTTSIYLKSEEYNKGKQDSISYQNDEFARFFSGGQVLFVRFDGGSPPQLELINNQNLGIPGYYIVKGNKIKIDKFQLTNGGQTGKYFGRVLENGDLIFYEARPETYRGSFNRLEKNVSKTKYSIWKKIDIIGIIHYNPKW